MKKAEKRGRPSTVQPKTRRVRSRPEVEEGPPETKLTTPPKPLWQRLFFVGTEFNELPAVFQANWDFSNLDHELSDGVLNVPVPTKGKKGQTPKVHLFAQTEGLTGEGTDVKIVPVVVAAVSVLPPSESMGIASIQMDASQHQVVPLRYFQLSWMPTAFLDPSFWDSLGEMDPMRLDPPTTFTLAFEQRHFSVDRMDATRKNEFTFSLPYVFNPFRGDDRRPPEEKSLLVIAGTLKVKTSSGEDAETAVTLEYDYKEDDIAETVQSLLEQESLDASRAPDVRAMIEEHVAKHKAEHAKLVEAYQAKLARLTEPAKESLRGLRLFKFYPANWHGFTTPYVNRYYGSADRVFSGAAPAPSTATSRD